MDDNRRNHVAEYYSDSFSTDSTGGHCIRSSRLYPNLSEESSERNKEDMESSADHQKQGKYFYYDSPLYEDTGVWIPVSVPPILEDDHKEWAKGFQSNGGYFPDEDMGWNQCLGEEKEFDYVGCASRNE
ncbi:hypothetical protein RJT34_25192 [Clitoria ternatea]|uniref:Uncharacterized protein n=1 Tax=Clitoria ternatea TaxID=43366 RepID=A0AAN9FPL2_CLITE